MSNGSVDPSHIKFGKTVYIDTKARLKKYDNGSALAYRAYDTNNKESKFIAIISSVENIPRCSSVAGYGTLNNTSFFRLVGSGIVSWSLENKQKYVFMYSGVGIGDCLVPKGGFSEHNWRHPDIVEYFVQPMLQIFKNLNDHNFFHGSIRSSNIYYASPNKNGAVILGDGLSVQSGSTQDSLFLPVSKALAEPMGRGDATLKDDIYAFGVSLVMFLRKTDVFVGLSDEDIVRKKIEIGSYATLVGNERFPVSFLELLRGVLHDDSDCRWGVDELFLWLDGTRMPPEPLLKKKKANRPITFFGKKYLYIEFLALDLYKSPNDLASIVEDGSLGRWIECSIDSSELLERYLIALDKASAVSSNKEYLVTQVSMVFNPSLPIRYKGLCFSYDGLGAMMAKSMCDGEGLECYKEILNLNILDQALLLSNVPQNQVIPILKQYDACRASLRNKSMGYGVERCLYLLCKNVSCLSPKLKSYFVKDSSLVVMAFESLSKTGGQIALMLDQHLLAYFAVLDPSVIDALSYNLNSLDKNKKILGNLSFMAIMQKRSGISSLPYMCSVFMESMSGMYDNFKNKNMQKILREGVEKAAKVGDLAGMAALLNDEVSLARDNKAFKIASAEYRMLVKEYNEYNRKLANKNTYGVVNGHNVAAIVSWLSAVVITVIVVLAFLSGNKIF